MHALTATLVSLFLLLPLGPGWLGVYLADTDRAEVTEVIPDSPAAKAGIEAGDVMLAVAGKATPTRVEFVRAIQSKESGSRVKIRLRRGERERTVTVRLGEREESAGAGGTVPPTPPAPPARPAPREEVRVPVVAVEQQPAGKPFLGLSVRETDRGIVVDRVLPDGPAADSGLQAGDRVTGLGKSEVRTLADLDRVLRDLRPGQRIAVAVRNEDATKSLRMRVGSRPVEGREQLPPAGKAPEPEEVIGVEVVVPQVEVVEEPVLVEIEVAEAGGNEQPRRPARVRVRRPDRESAEESRPAKEGEFDLQRELKELRRELAEVRRLLEELKRKGR